MLFAFLVSGWRMLGVGFGLAGRAQRERALETDRRPADRALGLISAGQSPNCNINMHSPLFVCCCCFMISVLTSERVRANSRLRKNNKNTFYQKRVRTKTRTQ